MADVLDLLLDVPFAKEPRRTPPLFIVAAKAYLSSLPPAERDVFLRDDTDFAPIQPDWGPGPC